MSAAVDPRKQRLARIHMGKKSLGLSEPEYRSLLLRASAGPDGLGGFDTAANMTPEQHIAVLREMGRLGFKAEARRGSHGGRPAGVLTPMLKKVEALLADAKRPWSYAHHMAERMSGGIKRVEWLDDHQLHKLVAALQIEANRRSRSK